MKLIRIVLGNFILFLDWLFSPTPTGIKKTNEQFVLYELKLCPFCIKVRRELKRLNVSLMRKDVGVDPTAAKELVEQGGLDQVPCLRIQNQDGSYHWMYESSEINAYLAKVFK